MKKLLSIVLIIVVFLLSGASTKDYIKWVDFNASCEIMNKALELDNKIGEINSPFYKTLAFIALKNGNKFNYNKDLGYLNELKRILKNGKTADDIYGENKYYKYYCEAYNLIFEGMIGSFTDADGADDYGLRGYHPIASGFYFNESDDFGNGRNFGFKRKHLGHDIFALTGTPVIAVENGVVYELGWNRYGGWRIGLSAGDGKRYYYYAHLRQNKPFHPSIKKGSEVKAGQVLGYVGRTGYSYTENTNMNTKAHLHFGLQLIFDESQRDGNGEIWVDVYQICRFLYKMRAQTVKDNQSGERDSINLISY